MATSNKDTKAFSIEELEKMMQENNGNLDLSGSNISNLPENLNVDGDLDLSNTNISSLPENLTVGGSLDLSNTNISSLPKSLKVGGDLDLSDTKIKKHPKKLKVAGIIKLYSPKVPILTAIRNKFFIPKPSVQAEDTSKTPNKHAEKASPSFKQLPNTPVEPSPKMPPQAKKQFKLAEDVVEFLTEHDPAFGYEPTTEGLRNKQEYVNTVFQAVQKDDVGYINRVNTLQTEMQQNTPSPKMAQPQVEPLSMEF